MRAPYGRATLCAVSVFCRMFVYVCVWCVCLFVRVRVCVLCVCVFVWCVSFVCGQIGAVGVIIGGGTIIGGPGGTPPGVCENVNVL
jgi:hypothetical protein